MEFLSSFLRDWEVNLIVKISFARRTTEGLGVGVQNQRGGNPHMGARPGTPPPLPRMYSAPWTEYGWSGTEARRHRRSQRPRRRRSRVSVPSQGCSEGFRRVYLPHEYEASVSSSLDNVRGRMEPEMKME